MLYAIPFVVLLGHGGEQVSLRFNAPVGSSYRYKMINKTQQMMGTADMSMTQEVVMDYKVMSVKQNLSSVRTTVEKVQVIVPNNSPMASSKAGVEKMLNGLTIDSVIDRQMKIVSSKVVKGNAMASAMQQNMQAGLQGVAYSASPVSVGSTWSSNIDMSKMGGMMPP